MATSIAIIEDRCHCAGEKEFGKIVDAFGQLIDSRDSRHLLVLRVADRRGVGNDGSNRRRPSVSTY